MALEKDMKLWQIKEFLEEELKEQIFLEIAPILYIGQTVGGYFGVTRHILCIINFLGALYCGYTEQERKQKKEVAPSAKALKFIKGVLGEEIDPVYKEEGGKYLYMMYRHGLVHLYQPKTIKQKNERELKWLIYKGARERADITAGNFRFLNIRHLKIITDPRDKKYDLLPVSITILYKDLLTAIDIYYKLLEEDESNKLLENWQSSVDVILEPELEKGGE